MLSHSAEAHFESKTRFLTPRKHILNKNLTKGKEYFLKNHNENVRENRYWANALETYLDTKVDITRDFEQTLQSITADDARRAIEQLMRPKNHTEVIMVGVAE